MNKRQSPPLDERLDNPVGYYRYGDAPETTPYPSRLHTHGVECGGVGAGDGRSLGAPPFSREMARFLKNTQPLAVERAEFARTHWWANSYWRRRVAQQFVLRFGSESGALRYQVALALARGCESATIQTALHRTGYWVGHQREIAESFAQIALRRAVITTPPDHILKDTKDTKVAQTTHN